MSLLNKQIQAFGLDISDSSVKVMMLQRKGSNIRPVSFSAEIFPRGIVVKDEIKEPAKLADIIKQAVQKAKPQGINTPYVITSLPESKSFIRMFSLPPMKRDEVEAAVKWEAEQHIPMAIDQVEIDWQIINDNKADSGDARSYQILLTAAPKDTINPIVDILKKSGLQPIALEIESVSTARSCISPTLAKENVMIIDIGTNRTGLSIVSNGLIHFTSSLAIAGVDISNNIVSQTGLSFTEAEKAKIKHGLDEQKQEPAVFKAINETLESIVNEIKNTINYYQEHSESSNKIDHLLLCGGTTRLRGLPAYFTKELTAPIHLANPWVNLYDNNTKDLPPISNTDSLGFTTVIGLAQRGLDFKIK